MRMKLSLEIRFESGQLLLLVFQAKPFFPLAVQVRFKLLEPVPKLPLSLTASSWSARARAAWLPTRGTGLPPRVRPLRLVPWRLAAPPRRAPVRAGALPVSLLSEIGRGALQPGLQIGAWWQGGCRALRAFLGQFEFGQGALLFEQEFLVLLVVRPIGGCSLQLDSSSLTWLAESRAAVSA